MSYIEVDNYTEYYRPILEKLGYMAEYIKHPKKLHGKEWK